MVLVTLVACQVFHGRWCRLESSHVDVVTMPSRFMVSHPDFAGRLPWNLKGLIRRYRHLYHVPNTRACVSRRCQMRKARRKGGIVPQTREDSNTVSWLKGKVPLSGSSQGKSLQS